jgi:hypothetical protein
MDVFEEGTVDTQQVRRLVKPTTPSNKKEGRRGHPAGINGSSLMQMEREEVGGEEVKGLVVGSFDASEELPPPPVNKLNGGGRDGEEPLAAEKGLLGVGYMPGLPSPLHLLHRLKALR